MRGSHIGRMMAACSGHGGGNSIGDRQEVALEDWDGASLQDSHSALRTLFQVMPVSLAFAIAQARSEWTFAFVVAGM